jgi:hypothetical protein
MRQIGVPVASTAFRTWMTPILEPFTVTLFGAGIAGAAALRRKRSP